MSSEHDSPASAKNGAPAGQGSGSGSKERDLLEAVLGQAEERPSAFGKDDATAMPPPDSFPGYELLHEIHRGGQGVVYLAVQKATKRRVAIKVLHEGPFAGSSGRSRFEREVQILGQLNHPNIVHIHDSGVTPTGSFFYVMDYISGRTLDDLIEGKAPIPSATKAGSKAPSRSGGSARSGAASAGGTDDVLRLFLKICEGVNAAHLKGVIHRDLKPANIKVDQRGEPIVVDFGLAKAALSEAADEAHRAAMTMTGQFIGSLPWASPEQADGSPDGLDLRTDVYSLGVILYQMLTGKFPYSVVGNMRDVLDNILRAEPARPSTVGGARSGAGGAPRRINGEVETIVLKCLAKDKARRYQSAGELARDIERYLAGEPIEAKRDSALYLITKTLQRHRVTAGVLAAFAGVITFSSIGMTMLYGWEREARKDEQSQRQQAVAAKGEAESQRDRAERNFRAGRKLARAFIYDFSRDIANLRGATPARERLAQEAAAYLASLKGEIGEDPAMLRELADAFDQLGRIQGGLYLPRVGTTEEAAKSFAEARAIREALLARLPADGRALADAARSSQMEAWIAERAEDYAKAGQLYAAALAGWQRALAAGAPADLGPGSLTEPARILTAQGDAHVRLAEKAASREAVEAEIAAASERYDRAQAEWERLAAANPGDADAARGLNTLESKRAGIARSRGHAALDRAESILKGIAAGAELPAAAVDLLLEGRERLESAAARATAAYEKFSAAAEDDPSSGAAARDVYIVCHNLGYALSGAADIPLILFERRKLSTLPDPIAKALGTSDGPAFERDRRERALAVFQRALRIAERLADADPKNLEAQRDLAVILNKVGNEQRRLARLAPTPADRDALLAQSAATYTRSLDLRASLQKTDPTARQLRDLGLAEFKMAQISMALADAAAADSRSESDGAAGRRRAAWAAADRYARSCLARFGELAARFGALAENSPELTEARELQSEVQNRRGYARTL